VPVTEIQLRSKIAQIARHRIPARRQRAPRRWDQPRVLRPKSLESLRRGQIGESGP
jgi:hypothetical protein